MKLIPLQCETGKLKSIDMLRIAVVNAPNGARLDEQRHRWRLLDALDALDPGAISLTLEDADCDHLRRIIQDFPWNIASLEMRPILEGVMNAQAPPA